jgi:hypothetical protein
MWRAILIAIAGQAAFIISAIAMSPLRIWENPVVNYNLFYMPIVAVIFFFLFYRCCTVEQESKAYLYGFFAALAAWPLIGEISSLPVDKGVITQFSDVEIKTLGGYYFVVAGWIILKILWLTGALKRPLCVFLFTFLSIWSFELYMDNYSSMVPVELMPVIGNYVAAVAGLVAVILLIVARKTASLEKKTMMGCMLYITLALIIMGLQQWRQPSPFYVTYEASHIDKEIAQLQEEKEQLNGLKQYMLEKSLLDGKSIKYMRDRDLISESDVQEAFNKGLFKEKDRVYLKDKGIIKEAAAEQNP